MRLIRERRAVTYAIVFGVWGLVAGYAVVHDQVIVRIAPEHFTVHHPPLWGMEDAAALALGYALRSSLAPGLLWGLALAHVARNGPRPKVPVGVILRGSLGVILLTESLAVAAGWWVWRTERMLLPEVLYPDDGLPMRITTTVQGVCYVAGAFLAGMWTLRVAWRRRGQEPAVAGPTHASRQAGGDGSATEAARTGSPGWLR
jgi:hypothetical protein